MKTLKNILCMTLLFGMSACIDLDLPPLNVIQNTDVFGSQNGINSYLVRVYSGMPMEDFRYSPERGFFNGYVMTGMSVMDGEAICSNQGKGAQSENTKYWGDAYNSLRDINYFLETLPQYASNFHESDMNTWKGEMYFNRAFVYFALVKRYGGVPIVNEVLNYPGQSIEELKIPRSSEDAVYQQVKADLDMAYELLPETNELGRATKYAALALKSRAMLFAGSIAKYNEIELVDKNTGYQLCGIPATKATEYFKAAYDAAKMLEGHFSLYKKEWVADNKEAQYQNFVNMFFDDNSPENILIRQYLYPNSTHSYDCFSIPRQFMVGGYSSAVGPTLDFVEMFDGFPKDENGHIKTTENGKYMLYDNLTDLFKDAEPRLRATVILPGEQFKGEAVEMWRGIYIGPTDGGISPLIPEGTLAKYESTECKDLIVTSANGSEQTPYKLSNGEMMNPAGRSGCFYNDEASAISGFSVRKYLDPNLEASLVVLNRSAQSWIEFRYGEVLLNRAEAAMELAEAGQGESYKEDAYTCINVIRERAGATLLGNVAETTMEIVRTERRKELGFENKTWWDMKRWRTLDREQNNRIYRILMPFYADKAGKWFFDARYDEKNTRYTVDSRWYYLDIPVNIINSDGLVQNPGY